MLFDDWKEHPGTQIDPTLLWNYDLSKFDWNTMKVAVVERVIQYGWPKDWYAAINLYGGLDNFIEIIKEIPVLSDKDANFVSLTFHIPMEEMKCYRHKQSREKLLLSWQSSS